MSARDHFIAAQARLLERVGVRAESRFLKVPTVSGRVHVLVAGEGPPVVLVPGFGDPTAMWAPLMAPLVAQGFTLYAVDRPCFGLTGGARHAAGTVRTLAVGFLEQVLGALGLERPPLVANSLGSLWTFWLALDQPSRVAAMVHVGCPAFLLGTSAPLPMRLLATRPWGRLLMAVDRPSRAQVERFAVAFASESFSDFPEMVDLLAAMQRLPGVRPAIRELLRSLLRLRGPRPEVVLTEDRLRTVRQPTLLVWGERDRFGGPEVGERAAAALPRGELQVVPGAGHVPWVLHPDEVAEVAMPFLRALSSAGTRLTAPRPATAGSP